MNYKNTPGSVQNVLANNYGKLMSTSSKDELYNEVYRLFVKNGIPSSNGAVRLLNRIKLDCRTTFEAHRAITNCMNYSGKPKHKPVKKITEEIL